MGGKIGEARERG